MCSLVAGFLLLLVACGSDDGGNGADTGPARISTLAYVVNTCDQPAGQGLATFQQTLWVRQGEREPVKVLELPAVPMPFCHTLAETRDGSNALYAAAFQRMGVSPKGDVVLFEVTYDFSPLRFEPWVALPEDKEGLFMVRADGTGLHRIGPHSQERDFVVDPACYLPGAGCSGGSHTPVFEFSPDCRTVVLTDRGRDSAGKMSAQIFTLDLRTGARRQITQMTTLPRCDAPGVDDDDECLTRDLLPIVYPRFIDARTIAFWRPSAQNRLGVPFTVDMETGKMSEIPRVALGDGVFVPLFEITGEPVGMTNTVPGEPVNGPGINGNTITEAFVTDGKNIAQITNFRRSDTVNTRVTLDHERVIFETSENRPELGTNPRNYCQWFSAGVLGGDVRQLTFFGSDAPGCNCGARACDPPACTGTGFMDGLDWGTGSIVFGSTCDPFGSNPTLAGQIFAMRPDGGGLRQLTLSRGIERGADGSLHFELPGPFAVATRLR